MRYLSIEPPDTEVTIDFLGEYGVTIKARLENEGELWLTVTGANYDAPILLDQLLSVPKTEDEECE